MFEATIHFKNIDLSIWIDKVSQLEHEWGFEYSTLADDKWVSSKFEISRRSRSV